VIAIAAIVIVIVVVGVIVSNAGRNEKYVCVFNGRVEETTSEKCKK
jgi:hypothetical protein